MDRDRLSRIKAEADRLRAQVLAARAEERANARAAAKAKRDAEVRAKKLEAAAAKASCDVRVAKARRKAKCVKKTSNATRPKPAGRPPEPLLLAAPVPRRKVHGIKKLTKTRLAASPGQRRARAKERAATLTRDELIALQFAIAQAEEEAQDAEDREDLRAASRHRARAMDLKAQLTGVKKPTSAAASAPRTSIGPSVWMPTATARIASLKSVLRAKAWTKVPGKERIYVDLTKMNGGANWNQGIGHRVIVFADGSVRLDEQNSKWAGARTRDWHHENKTLKKISDAVADARGAS